MERLKTLQGAIAYFSDPQRAFDAAVQFRWPGGNVTCPRCGQAKHSFIKTRRLWFCYVCQKQFTVKVGTIMEDSPIGLDKWMIGFLDAGKLQERNQQLRTRQGYRSSPELGMVHASPNPRSYEG